MGIQSRAGSRWGGIQPASTPQAVPFPHVARPTASCIADSSGATRGPPPLGGGGHSGATQTVNGEPACPPPDPQRREAGTAGLRGVCGLGAPPFPHTTPHSTTLKGLGAGGVTQHCPLTDMQWGGRKITPPRKTDCRVQLQECYWGGGGEGNQDGGGRKVKKLSTPPQPVV